MRVHLVVLGCEPRRVRIAGRCLIAVAKDDTSRIKSIDNTLAKQNVVRNGIIKEIKYTQDLKAKIPGAVPKPEPIPTPIGIVSADSASGAVLDALKSHYEDLKSQYSAAHEEYQKAAKGDATPSVVNDLGSRVDDIGKQVDAVCECHGCKNQ